MKKRLENLAWIAIYIVTPIVLYFVGVFAAEWARSEDADPRAGAAISVCRDQRNANADDVLRISAELAAARKEADALRKACGDKCAPPKPADNPPAAGKNAP